MRAAAVLTLTTVLSLAATSSPATAVLSYFDVISDGEIITGPPYPTACHRADVAHEAMGVFERDGQAALGVRRARDSAGRDIGVDLRAVDLGSGDGFWATTCFEFMHRGGAEGPALSPESRIDLMVELTDHDGRPGKLVVLHPERHVVDPERYFDVSLNGTSLELLCRVDLGGGIVHELSLLAELPPGLTLADSEVAILEQRIESGDRSEPTLAETYFSGTPDGLFDVRLLLATDSSFDGLLPMVSLTVSGRFLGGMSPVRETTWGAVKALYNE